MKEVWQWIVRWKCQTVAWCKRQFTWWIEQAFWVRVFAFALSVLVGLLVIIALAFIGYGLFCIDTDIARNLILLTGGIVGWYFLARRTNIAEREVNISEQNLKKYIDFARKQFLSENLSTRREGIIELEKIALSHEKERKKIIRILSDGIRDIANREDIKKFHKQRRFGSSNVTIAFKTLANIAEPLGKEKKEFINMSGIDLSNLRLSKIDLSHFPFKDMVLIGAIFSRINFAGTDFSQSNIDDVNFKECIGLTKEQIMEAYWEEGKRPQGLPEKWNLPSKTI